MNDSKPNPARSTTIPLAPSKRATTCKTLVCCDPTPCVLADVWKMSPFEHRARDVSPANPGQKFHRQDCQDDSGSEMLQTPLLARLPGGRQETAHQYNHHRNENQDMVARSWIPPQAISAL
jgi:hypothetical protein